jgi:membrane associated rhomboid family serine protease
MNDVVDVRATAPRPATTFVLRRTPTTRSPWQALVLLLAAWAPSIGLPLLWHWYDRRISTSTALVLAGIAVVVAVAWLVRTFALPRTATIVVDDEAIEVPVGRQRLRLMLDEVVSVRDLKGALQIVAVPPAGTPPRGHQGAVVVAARCFSRQAGAHVVLADVVERLGRREDGAARVQRLAVVSAAQERFAAIRPVVSWTTIAICTALFLVEAETSATISNTLLATGANIPTAVFRGEVWRLVGSNLLHASYLHLVMNMVGLLSTGAVIERWLGRHKMLIILVISGVGGQLASATMATINGSDRSSIGISGAVFGLLGVLLASTLRFRTAHAGGLRVPLAGWLLLLITNVAISSIPVVDVVAHVGGLVSGALVAQVLMPKPGVHSTGNKHVGSASAVALCIVVAAVARWVVAMAAA